MQLVAALNKQPLIRALLCLFEGVVTVSAFDEASADAMAQKGPCLIEVML